MVISGPSGSGSQLWSSSGGGAEDLMNQRGAGSRYRREPADLAIDRPAVADGGGGGGGLAETRHARQRGWRW